MLGNQKSLFCMLRNTRAQNLSNEYTFPLAYDYIQSFKFLIRFSTGKQTKSMSSALFVKK
jgi:hypothetical protein